MNLEDTVLIEMCRSHRDRKENGVCQGLGQGGWDAGVFMGTDMPPEEMKRFWRQMMVMVAQPSGSISATGLYTW